ncbi:MAG: potassium channel family protein [Bacteroidetes bacterium]|nr:potassium channel family protein [Bacteroidota bacterium]
MEILLHKPEPELNDFKVTLLEKKFISSSGTEFSKTAQIDFFDAKGRKKETKEFGFVSAGELYEKMENGQPVNLNECYVQNFSLGEFRKQRALSEMHPVHLKIFSAKNSFFDCDVEVDFSHAVFENSKIFFEESVFGNGTINFSHAKLGEGAVSFRRSRFGEGTVDFRFAEFGAGNSGFRFTHFGAGDVLFVNTKFGGDADFQSVTWGEGVSDFRYAKFSGNVSFEKSVFGAGKIDFKAVEFLGDRVDFKRVQWGDGDVSFEGAEFNNSKTSFRSSVFGKGDISFEEADFGSNEISFENCDFYADKVNFYRAKSAGINLQSCRMNSHFDFRFNQCASLNLHDSVLRDIVDLIPGDDSTPIQQFNFSGIKNLGRINIDWKKNHVKRTIYNQTDTSLLQKGEQFRILKEEFHAVGQYLDEDKSYVEYMRCEQKSLLQAEVKKNKMNAAWAYPIYFFKWLVFDKMGRYATDPVRVLVSMIFVYVGFSTLYCVLPQIMYAGISCSGADNASLSYFLQSFYYSAITFLTIGYGDCLPVGVIHWLAPIEGWMGVVMMSYFTVAFVRKILR